MRSAASFWRRRQACRRLQAVLGRAAWRGDLGMWLVQASVSELDEMYSLVEALMDAARSRKRLDLLDGLLATLCTSIDGF
jgi:hypothetical protein